MTRSRAKSGMAMRMRLQSNGQECQPRLKCQHTKACLHRVHIWIQSRGPGRAATRAINRLRRRCPQHVGHRCRILATSNLDTALHHIRLRAHTHNHLPMDRRRLSNMGRLHSCSNKSCNRRLPRIRNIAIHHRHKYHSLRRRSRITTHTELLELRHNPKSVLELRFTNHTKDNTVQVRNQVRCRTITAAPLSLAMDLHHRDLLKFRSFRIQAI